MATTKTEAQKVEALRKQAMDKTLPQEVRDMADKKANEIEGRSVKKATGIELAKGGAVRKYGMGGFNPPVDKTKPLMDAPRGVVKGGRPAAMPKPAPKPAPKQIFKEVMSRPISAKPLNPTMMAKGGDAKKKMMMGGAVVANAPAKDLPMRGQRTATNMAKGGSAAKKGKK